MAGNSQGYIYSPHTLHYQGLALEIKAGETFIILPYQPMGLGPWKIYTTVLVNEELKTRVKNPKVFCIRITNKWLTKIIKLPRYTSLESLLATTGIEHKYTTMTFDDINTINGDDDDDDVNDDCTPPNPPACCECACCLKIR